MMEVNRTFLPPFPVTSAPGLPDADAAALPQTAEVLLPLVYGELRKLAASRMAQKQAGQTLQPTAVVHEGYLKLGGISAGPGRRIFSEQQHRRCAGS